MQNNKLTIKNWAEEDRPREKLLIQGKNNLSNAELLAILLGSGTKSLSAVDVAKHILQDTAHSLNNLARLDINDLKRFKGIGEAKAIAIVSAMELGRRRIPDDRNIKPKLTTALQTYQYMKSDLQELRHEEFWAIFLRRNHEVVNKHLISKGGVSGTLVDPKLIFKKAIDELSAAIVLIHNHPSGTAWPSDADIRLTRKIQSAAKLLDVSVLDHIIFTDEGYYSFSDEKLL